MIRVLPEERAAILRLLENEAKHLKIASEPVHYMIYGRNAENAAVVSENLQKVREASMRLAASLKGSGEGRNQHRKTYSKVNDESNGRKEERKSNLIVASTNLSKSQEDFYYPGNYVRFFKTDLRVTSCSSSVPTSNSSSFSDNNVMLKSMQYSETNVTNGMKNTPHTVLNEDTVDINERPEYLTKDRRHAPSNTDHQLHTHNTITNSTLHGSQSIDLSQRRGSKNLIIDQVLPNNKVIISIRLLCSPPNYKAQDFHLDYGQDFETVDTIFVGVTPSVAGNSTEVLQWSNGELAKLIRETARRKNTLKLGKDVVLLNDECSSGEKKNVNDRYTAEDQVIYTTKPRLIPLEMETWGVAVLRTSHHFHRRGNTFGSNFTRLTLNIDLVDAAEFQKENQGVKIDEEILQTKNCERNGSSEETCFDEQIIGKKDTGETSGADGVQKCNSFVCIDTLRSLQDDRVCSAEIIDNLYEQDVVLVGELY